MTSIGKARRLSRLFGRPSGNLLCVPIDHGMQVGAIDGLDDMECLITQIAEGGANSVIVNPGTLRRFHASLAHIPTIIMRLDQTTMWRVGSPYGYPGTYTRQIASVQEAVELGADAVITYLFMCNSDPQEETRCFDINAQVARECNRLGIPHVIEAMAANGGFASAEDPELVKMNCRIASELGADIVKTDWCGMNGIKEVAQTCLAPVCVAGGTKEGSIDTLVETARVSCENGARGIFFGRNVFQRSAVADTIRKIGDAI